MTKPAPKKKPMKKKGDLKNPPGTSTSPQPKGAKKLPSRDGDGKLLRSEEEHQVYVKINEDQVPALTDEMINLMNKEKRLELAKKDAVAGFRAELKEVKEMIDGIATKIQRGETITVMCEKITDFDAGIVKWVRKDTREEVERRPIEPADHQLTLNTQEANAETHESAAQDASDRDLAGEDTDDEDPE